MRKIYFTFFFFAFILCGAVAIAQEGGEFTVKAQVRPRFEYNHGALLPLGKEDKATSFISNRARLSLGYDNGFLSMGVSGQDISIWGQKPQVDNAANFTLNEAWAKIYKNGVFAQIGRQSLIYDDERILGALDWNQAGRWHDALKLGYENYNHTAHLIFAYNQTSGIPRTGTFYYNGGQPYKFMQSGYYMYNNKENFSLSALFMNLGMQGGKADEPATQVYNMQTFGANISYTIKKDLNLFGTFYYQTGKNTADKTIRAYMFAGKAKYNVAPLFSVALGADYLSGQDTNSDKATAFNPLYGTHHKFYGAMDYFYASSYPAYGLMDIYASLIFKPLNKCTVDFTYHNFSAQQPVKSIESSKGLGSEIDLTVTYPIRSYITLQGGYSMMFGTDAFFAAKGGHKDRTQHWAFLSLSINPTIFKSRF